MKIGIITFHGATNYGAVLQAYALQHFLEQQEHDVKLINFAPKEYQKTFLKCFWAKRPEVLITNLENYIKECSIRKFRIKYLNMASSICVSKEELIQKTPVFNVYISGSDQIWNPLFIRYRNKDLMLSYFLDFLPIDALRISYATSFGLATISDEIMSQILPMLNRFSAISMREQSGVEILKKYGIDSQCVLDPTLLLDKDEYIRMMCNTKNNRKAGILTFILHKEQSFAQTVIQHIKQRIMKPVYGVRVGATVEEWLLNIQESQLVITNSFHCVVFSLLFHIPFLALPVQSIDMNDRIVTLLTDLGLGSRLLRSFEPKEMDQVLYETINWDDVDKRISTKRKYSAAYLFEALKTASTDNKFNYNL